MKIAGLLLVVLLAALLAESGSAAEPQTRPATRPAGPELTFHLTVDPAGEPQPALKIRFLADFADQHRRVARNAVL